MGGAPAPVGLRSQPGPGPPSRGASFDHISKLEDFDLTTPEKPRLFRPVIVRRSHNLYRNQSSGKYLNLVVCRILRKQYLPKVPT